MQICTAERSEPFVSEGSIQRQGVRLSYCTVCEELFVELEPGKAAGSLFTYSYFMKDGSPDRPVIFAYNGGPGSSSLLLHMGFFGPYTVKLDGVDLSPLPPYQCGENPNCLLDAADLVLVDPVGTGYGRLLDEAAAKDFFSIEGDAEAMALCISRWIEKYGRYQSPKFLFGESYGTIRNFFVPKYLLGKSIHLDGIMMLGSCLMEGHFPDPMPVELSALSLPSFAAANWYHNGGEAELGTVIDEAYAFAGREYLPALFAGTDLPEEQREQVLKKLSRLSGLTEEYLRGQALRIPEIEFLSQLLKEEGRVISYYDARFTLSSDKGWEMSSDPALSRVLPAFKAVWSEIARDKLGVRLDREYKESDPAIGKAFTFETSTATPERLLSALSSTPGLRMLFLTGRYDMCTTVGMARYAFSRPWFPKERAVCREYPSGHMAYIDEASAALMENDIREFLSAR